MIPNILNEISIIIKYMKLHAHT